MRFFFIVFIFNMMFLFLYSFYHYYLSLRPFFPFFFLSPYYLLLFHFTCLLFCLFHFYILPHSLISCFNLIVLITKSTFFTNILFFSFTSLHHFFLAFPSDLLHFQYPSHSISLFPISFSPLS